MRSKTRRNADGRIRVNVTEGEIVVQTQFGLPAFIGLNDLKGYAKFSVLLLGINQSADALDSCIFAKIFQLDLQTTL